MEDADDFFLKEFDGPRMALCRKCGEIKPVAAFEPMGTLCKACKPKSKPPTKRTARELQARVDEGKMSQAMADSIVATRTRNARAKMAAGVQRRHKAERGLIWDDMIKLRNGERALARKAYDYATDPKNGYRQYDAEFYAEYLLVLDRIGDELRRLKRNGAPIDYSRWEDLCTTAEQVELRRLWAAIPPDMRRKGRPKRIPVLLDITTKIPGGFTDEDYGIPKDSEFSAPTNVDSPEEDKPSPFKGIFDDLM